MHYVSSRAGAGKSYAFADIALLRSNSNRNTIIIAPTVKLAVELQNNIITKGGTGRVTVFYNGDGTDEAVTSRVVDYLDNPGAQGAILIITHQCFLHLPFFPRKTNWRLLVDENISLFAVHKLNLHENHGIITEHLELVEAGSTFARVSVRDELALRRILNNRNNDDVWRGFRDVCSRLLRTDSLCFVQAKQFNELVHGLKPKGQLAIYSLLKPDRFRGFEQVTFASAGFEDTLTYNYWQGHEIEWLEDEEVKSGIQRPAHPNNPRLTILYGYEGRNSKNLRNRLEKDGNGELREAAIRAMEGEPFLWLENKDRAETSILNGEPNGKRLPPVSAGLNEFDAYRHAIILPAYNHDPGAADFLTGVAGFDKAMQAREMVGGLYQACMRTALRKDELEGEARWVVACGEEAQLLSERFPGSTVKPLRLTPLENRKSGRPPKYASDNDRKRDFERRRREELARCAGFAVDLSPALLERVVFLNEQDETTYKSIGHFVRDFRGSYFETWKQTHPLSVAMTESRFISYLKEQHKKVYQQKNDIPCIAGAMFDHSLTNNKNIRYEGNVAFCRGIWLDIENGDLTPSLFEQAFPLISFVAYSTFNHTKQNPRYRVYIQTNRPMSFEESIAIYHELRHSLKTQGWMNGKKNAERCASTNRPFDGIDCRPNPSQLSLLPCQSLDRKASFFLDKTKGKRPLDVDAWLNYRSWFDGDDEFYDLPPVPDDGEETELTLEQAAVINAATNQWEMFGRQRGDGDAGIFALYLELRRARIPITEMEWRLYRAAEQSSSPKDRKDQVRRLIQDFKRRNVYSL